MKKVVSLLLTFIMLTFTLCACNGAETERLDVYFKSRLENDLNAEKRKMEITKKTSEIDRAKFVISQLIEGPQNDKNEAIISKKAKLIGIAMNNGVVTINMSRHFGEVKKTNALLLRRAMVNSLCTIEGIDGIVIQVEGKPLVSENTGKEFGVLTLKNVVSNTDGDVSETTKTITLYFPDKSGDRLCRETREVEMQKALSLEKTVVDALIKGPENSENTKALPPETKLLGIETKDNICFVNFSSEFVSKTSSGSLATTLALYSVVNSLCELDNVKSVQILINGENGVEFGNYVLDIPYEMDESLIQ